MVRMCLACCVFLWGLLLQPAVVHAQVEDYAASFKSLTEPERVTLRQVLALPVPEGALNTTLLEYFRNQRNAAERLGDQEAMATVFRRWTQAMPQEILPKNELAGMLQTQGDFEAALALRREVLGMATGDIERELYRQRLAITLFESYRLDEAQKVNDVARASLPLLKSKFPKPQGLFYTLRVESAALALDSRLHRRFGRWTEAVQSASRAVEAARESLKLVRTLPSRGDAAAQARDHAIVADIGRSIAMRTAALGDAHRFGEAEASLREYVRLSREEQLPPLYLQGINQLAGTLSMDQRLFSQAEAYYRRADQVYQDLGYPETHAGRTTKVQEIVAALAGQRRWDQALAELARVDALAASDAALQKRVRFAFERGYVYLGAGVRTAEAATLFQTLLNDVSKRFPDNHFFVAQARGLRGVALWRVGAPQRQAEALALLRSAVRDYMLPDNMDYETMGLRKDVRELVFATYLEAMFQSSPAGALEAMTPADWVRGGLVQEAIADAAVRSAAVDPKLNDLVRQDQNARNEIEALRKFLAGEEGSTQTMLPEIAAKMRERTALLEGQRQKLQAELRSRFPDYDRLVRPRPPTAADIAKALAPDEALIMLLPTADAVYAWAVAADGGNAAVRVAFSGKALAEQVKALRQTLDFSEMGSLMTPFQAVASADLYQRLLKPLEVSFAGKKHLVIAAGGALGQIPFGVLLTQPTKAVNAEAPWLIKRYAITHVPSLGSWLAVKQFAQSKPAPEALVAWGDPKFSGTKAATSVTQGALGAVGTAGAVATRHVALTRAALALDLEKDSAVSALKYADIPELPETRDELLSIARALQADANADLHLGTLATKASVLQSNAKGELLRKRVVAFATHGLMAGDLPRLTQPALALASAGNEDQEPLGALLGLDEVLNLKLNADWVVLSACNTAAADGRGDEALSGLARGFFYAGSRSLLVTHWAVESESAKELTTRTMQHYASAPQERKADSLRQAMLEVMANPKFAHPAFWAPYALVGDGGR